MLVRNMLVNVTATETHETVHDGQLTGDQFKALVIDGLKRSIGISHDLHGYDLELTIGERLMETLWPDVHFSLTKDHLWPRKATPPHEF